MLGIIFFLILVIILFLSQGMEFRRRAKEIINFYNSLEEYLIKNSKWSKVMSYPSVFYDVRFQTSEEAISTMTFMIRDAIKCFKQQNVLARTTTEKLLDELYFIQRKLMIIHTFG